MRIDLFATNVFQRLVLLDLNWISFFEIEREIESELHPCLKILHFFLEGGGLPVLKLSLTASQKIIWDFVFLP